MIKVLSHQYAGALAGDQAIVKASGHLHQWLAGGYDLEMGNF